MRAVILAAGRATRLQPYSHHTPKTLMELEPGVSILSFIVNQLKSSGILDIAIVTMPDFADIFKEISPGLRIIQIKDEDSFGNLYSAYIGCEEFSLPLLLVMSDHIVERRLLRKMIKRAKDSQKAFILCLDRKPSLKTAEEGLKLLLHEGRVVETGKELTPTYGIDTGVIFCGPRSLQYMEEAIKEYGKEASLKDAINLAAANNDVDFVDVTGLLWKDIDTPSDLEAAREIYHEILRRDLVKPSDGLVSRLLNRSISTRISLYLYKKGLFIHPNIISLISFIAAALGATAFPAGFFLVGGLLIQIASILDGVDGEVARLFKATSSQGEVFDNILDRVADIAVIAGVAAASWPLSTLDAILSIIAAASATLVSQTTHMLSRLNIEVDNLRKIPATRDARLFSVFICSAAGYPLYSVYYIAFASAIFVIAGLVLLFRGSLTWSWPMPRRRRSEAWPRLALELTARGAVHTVIVNAFRLTIGLLVTRLLLTPFADIVIMENHVTLEVATFLPLAEIGVIIYFGSKIIVSSGILVELASAKLVHRLRLTSTIIRETISDTTYLFLALILWTYSWSLGTLPITGPYIVKSLAPATAIIIIYMVYRLVDRLYKAYREAIEEEISTKQPKK
ncbi:Bifunctional IPC transferase and DIPP synthase [Candidatus Calditenuaceae archaeon HR02]|nr:Bifunctional IPC transferase and DIPP synthase [Candidatus Calditenuaceae archaeon HR02]